MTLKVFVLCFAVCVTKTTVAQRFGVTTNICRISQWQCNDGLCINADFWCDGYVDCPDGSDEAPFECNRSYSSSRTACPDHSYDCGDSCINGRLFCNGEYDCTDGRDETQYACQFMAISACRNTKPSIKNGDIQFSYEYQHLRETSRQEERDKKRPVPLKIKCDLGYTLGSSKITCVKGTWYGVPPTCTKCGLTAPVPRRTTPEGDIVQNGEAPWHVGIYNKLNKPPRLICGATLMTSKHLLSAAQCFWDDAVGVLPATVFAAAAGKTYSGWGDERDMDAQFSDVDEVNVPEQFLGETRNMEHNLALVTVTVPFEFTKYVRPICIAMSDLFSRQHVGEGGRMAAWGLTSTITGYQKPETLKFANLQSLKIDDCRRRSTDESIKYLTDDKLCTDRVGIGFGTEVAGSGFVYSRRQFDEVTMHIQGVASMGIDQSNMTTMFTNLYRFDDFIRQYINTDP